jgi:hypothetical protein
VTYNTISNALLKAGSLGYLGAAPENPRAEAQIKDGKVSITETVDVWIDDFCMVFNLD